MAAEWPPEGSPLAVTSEMEAAMKKMNYPLVKVRSVRQFSGALRGEGKNWRGGGGKGGGREEGGVCAEVCALQQCDMNEEMRNDCMDIMVGGVEKYPTNMELACKLIKETMDKKYGAPWHVRCSHRVATRHLQLAPLLHAPRHRSSVTFRDRSSQAKALASLSSTRRRTCATCSSLGRDGASRFCCSSPVLYDHEVQSDR